MSAPLRCVDRVRLAVLSPKAPIGSRDLDHGDTVLIENTCESGAVGSGALNPDRPNGAMAAKPSNQVGVATVAGGELG